MSDGYRSVALQSLIYIAIGLFIFGAVMLAWFLGYSLGEDQGNNSYSAEYHENYAADRIERECIARDISGFELHKCIQEQIESSQERENAQSDLKAQSRMAHWAIVMGMFTGLAVIVTGVGVVFVYRTLIATQDMARDTTNIGKMQVRAHLHLEIVDVKIDAVRIDGADCIKAKFTCKIVNDGNSPAMQNETIFNIFASRSGERTFVRNDGSDLPFSQKTVTSIPARGHVNTELAATFPADLKSLRDERSFIGLSYVFRFMDVFGDEVFEPLVSGSFRNHPEQGYVFAADRIHSVQYDE